MKKYAFILGLAALALTLVACRNPLDGQTAESGSITVRLTLPGTSANSSARTAIPDLFAYVDTYRIDLTSQSGYGPKTGSLTSGIHEGTQSYVFSDIEPGTWTVTVTGFIDTIPLLGGTKTGQILAADGALPVTVELRPLAPTGTTGLETINLSVCYLGQPSEVDAAHFVLKNSSDVVVETVDSTFAQIEDYYQAGYTNVLPVTAGTYTLEITLYRGGTSGEARGTFREAVNVYAGLATNRWITETGELTEFLEIGPSALTEQTDMNTLLSDLTIDGITPSNNFLFTFAPATRTYTIPDIPMEFLSFFPTGAVMNQKIEWSLDGTNYKTIASGSGSGCIPLPAGTDTVLRVRVTASNHTDVESYVITVKRPSVVHPISIIPGVSLDMVEVAGGSFQLDASANTTTVSTFRMGKYEVTQAQWAAVMGTAAPADPDFPQANVSWYDAVEFCNLLSVKHGAEPVYTITARTPTTGSITSATVAIDMSKNGYRLPTEMEWMWAAMGANKAADYVASPYTTGYDKPFSGENRSIPGDDALAYDYSWNLTSTGSDNLVRAKGTKLPNELGIYDMSGNVSEYCQDACPPSITYSYGSSGATDYYVAADGMNTSRLFRGGDYSCANSNEALGLSVNGRNNTDPGAGAAFLGFRIVRRL